MGYRAIQDTVPLSESLASVSYLAECLFWRILSQADDCGRLPGSAAKIRVSCMGLRDVTHDEVEEALEELVRVGRINRACVRGEWVCQILDFEANQPVGLLHRSRPSRFPALTGVEVSAGSADLPQEKRKEKKRREEHLAAQKRAATNADAHDVAPPEGAAHVAASTEDATAEARTTRRGRRRDLLFDALVEAIGTDPGTLTKTGRGAVNRALRELREVGADAEEIRRRATEYRHQFTSPLTAMALAKHWASLAQPQPERRARAFGRGVTSEEMAAAAEGLEGFASFREFDGLRRNGSEARMLDAAR